MTADDPRPAGERELLAAALQDSWRQLPIHTPGQWLLGDYFADALLPVVDRIASERAAAELEAAADYWDRPTVRTVAADLRERAIALRAAR